MKIAPTRLKKRLHEPQGFDAAKKVTGRKRHILVDTLGLLLKRRHPLGRYAGSRRRPARPQSAHTPLLPLIHCIFADAAYQARKTAAAIAKTGTWKLAIVKRFYAATLLHYNRHVRAQKVVSLLARGRMRTVMVYEQTYVRLIIN